MAFLALFFANEVMRRASQRQTELELALFKAITRIKQIETKMVHVDRLAAEIRYEKKRQAQTLTALANKGEGETKTAPEPIPEPTTPHERAAADHLTPSAYKKKSVG